MMTAFLTTYNGEVEVHEAINFEELERLKQSLGKDYVDIEIQDYIEDEAQESERDLFHLITYL